MMKHFSSIKSILHLMYH